MGKPGAFLEYGRQEADYRPVAERLRDYAPVERRMDTADVQIQAARCMDCGTPFCHGCGCPLNNVVPEVNDLVCHGRWQEALELLLASNNFPEFTAALCPALCEASCVLGISDAAVAIRQIEMAVIEEGFARGYLRPRPPRERLSCSVAVIGSGPAGLAVADTLNRAGCRVTVYEQAPKPGGILRYGIPDFKLDKRVLDRRLNLMKDEGVTFETGVTVGEDISLHYLQGRFAAVCLAVGSREPRDLRIPGRDSQGIHFALDYLAQQNRRTAGESFPWRKELDAAGRDVVVLGGGDTGSDCLGTALRQGARRVTQIEILPRPPATRPAATPWPQWPAILRESTSHKEGGERRWGTSTREFLQRNGRVCGLRCIEVDWPPVAEGRPRPVERPGTEVEIPADLVLLALGFVGPQRSPLVDGWGVRRTPRNEIATDARHMTSVQGIFATGDSVLGPSLIARAIADGRRTAAGILEYLGLDGA